MRGAPTVVGLNRQLPPSEGRGAAQGMRAAPRGAGLVVVRPVVAAKDACGRWHGPTEGWRRVLPVPCA